MHPIFEFFVDIINLTKMKYFTCCIFFCLLNSIAETQINPKTSFNPDEELKKLEIAETNGDLSIYQLIKKYRKIAASCTQVDHEYQKCFGLYKVMMLYSKDQKNEKELIEAAEDCLACLQPKIKSGAASEFTEIGKFYQEAIRSSTNIFAWYKHLKTNNVTELQQLLDIVNIGCTYIESSDHFYIYDTKVRILLKLKQNNEAYKLVYDCLRKNKYFGDFDDIKLDRNYVNWKNQYESANPLIYTQDEKDFLKKADKIHQELNQSSEYDKSRPNLMYKDEVKPEIMLLSEVKNKFGFTGDFHQDSDHNVLVLNGDVIVKGTLDNQWISDQWASLKQKKKTFGLVITGNLIIDGYLIDDEYIQIRVMKNLWCHYLYSYNGGIVISGDAHIKYGVYGEYNDGYLNINGKFFTPYIIADDHDMPRTAEGNFIYIEGGNGNPKDEINVGSSKGSGYGWDWDYFEDSSKLFIKGVWTDQDLFSEDQFFDLVMNGKNPFVKLD